jgi:hypothetical protein
MFIGHYGVAFAAKPTGPRVPLWIWFIAVQWLDILWSILALAGVEKFSIVRGFTEGSALDLYYMPYTHSLPGAIALSLLLGVIVALMLKAGNRTRTVLLVAAASFSHWILDLIVHVPDLPLYDNSAKVGFGLWRHVAFSLPLELALLGLGAWLYARTTTLVKARGQYLYWSFIVLLGALQIYTNLGAAPTSASVMALTALLLYVLLAVMAAWVERLATAPATAPP